MKVKKGGIILYSLGLSMVSACVTNVVMRKKEDYERERLNRLTENFRKKNQKEES